MKKELIIILLLLFVSFPAVKSLFLPGGFTSHDLTHHVVRQISMDKLLSEGQFPPRWSGELNNGYGYPVFLFNYPLPAIIGEGFHKLGFNFVDSVKAVLFLSMIISVLGMYLFLKELLGFRLAAFLGAVFYLYAPLRFSNIYVSAAVGSALALGIVPFVLWSLIEIKNGKKWASLTGAISLTGLILAHNVTALIFAPVIVVFAVILACPGSIGFWMLRLPADYQNDKTKQLRYFKNLVIMFLLGLGLSAWFWVPALAEKQFIRFDEVYSGFYKDQFVSLWQLLRSPWGYGLSHPGSPEQGDMSYQLGLVQIGVMLVYGLWFMVYGRKSQLRSLSLFILVSFAASIFLMLKISLPVWENLPFLSLVQFPLRFQAISIFAAAIGAALLVKYLPSISLSSLRKQGSMQFRSERSQACLFIWIPLSQDTTGQARNDMLRWLVFILLLVLVMVANRNHWHINEKFDPGEEYYLSLKTTSTTYAEHLPKWGRVMPRGAETKVGIVSGAGEVRVVRDQSAMVEAVVEASEPAKLRLNQFYFPGWQIKVDGKPVSFNYLLDGESYGLPVFDIEKGSHKIVAEFKNTADRNLADGISIISVVIFLILSFRGAKRRGNLS